MRRLAVAVVIVPVLLVACARGADVGSTPQLGRVRGSVVAGPACPVERAESPCPPRPVGGVEVRALDGSDVVARATTSGDGSFSMRLHAGRYLLEAEPTGFPVGSKPVEVIVRAGGVSRVTVLVDTGIR
jgi:hypothetical protein